MNSDCEQMAGWVSQWADGSLGPADARLVEEHLGTCAACRRQALRERAVHERLSGRAPHLREAAPSGLRARIQPGAAGRVVSFRPSEARVRTRQAWRLPLAASLLLALAGAGAYGTFAPSGTLLATQLALDHVKCMFLAHDETGVSPEALEARWQGEQGWTIDVPPASVAEGLELAGLRRCLFSGGSVAHVLYHYRGRTVSLFVLPEPRQAAAALEIMGYGTAAWSARGHTYALVGDLPADQLDGLARQFAQHVR